MTLIETMFGRERFSAVDRNKPAAGRNQIARLAQAATLATVCVFGPGLAAIDAQVVKAPRYQGGGVVEAPTPNLNLPPLPPATTPGGTVVEDVVVRVNDQIISRSDVERSEQQLMQESQQANMGSVELAQHQRDMLRDMIDQQLLLSRAKELGLNADADVIRRLDDIRKQNKLDTMEDLERAAKQQGVSFEDFKAKIRNDILTQQVVRDEVGRKLQLSQAEETKYYEDHKQDFAQPEQIRLSEILVPVAENATPAELEVAEKKAEDIKSKVAAGADFADTARKLSGGPSAASGGELGLWKRGSLAKVLEDQTFDLPVGESTKPIRTRQGFVILKVTEHAQPGPAPMKDVEPQIQEAIYMQQMQPALRTYLTKLRENAYIDVSPGFVDAGSTSKESKPVFTAYAPPPTKKKKAKKTVRFVRGGVPAAPKAIVSSPDTTGGRTLTGAEAAPVDPKTGMASIPGVTNVASNKKPKHTHREKIRYGQAPRNSLPAGTDEVAVGSTGTASTPVGATMSGRQPDGSVAPAALNAGPTPVETANSSSAATVEAENALAPAPTTIGKTRFAGRAKEEKEKKVKNLNAKEQEKIIARPVELTSQEKAVDATQSAPLGLAGDTTKKPKKPKKVKGAAKTRLEQKAPDPKPVETQVDPTASPRLAPSDQTPPSTRTPKTPPNAAAPANSSVPPPAPSNPDSTTLPPATAPVPGSPQPGTPVPGTAPPQ